MFVIEATTDDYFSGLSTSIRGARVAFEKIEELE